MINDEDQGIALATFKANLNYIISHCQSSGHTDILVMTPHHINPSDPTDPVSEATQLTYANAMRSVAAAASNSAFVTGVPVVDEFSNLVSFAFENTTLGAIYSPGSWPQDLHMNYFGYGIVGRDLAQTLLPVGGVGGGSLGASNVNVSGLLPSLDFSNFAGFCSLSGVLMA
jgi:hypothetical protein